MRSRLSSSTRLASLVAGALLACVTLALPLRAAAQPRPPLVAAASDLQFALPEISAAFTRSTGKEVRLVFGSSGNFVRQIEQGAPFAMFLSADEDYVFRLTERGLTRDDGALYAVGRIVLFAPAGSALAAALSADGLRARLSAGRIGSFAIANPEHAPYGRAAEQWLRKHRLWDSIAPVLVLGENASQAARFAASGNADGGIVPYSLAIAAQVSGRGRYVLLPAADHEPLRQRMVLLDGADADAELFYDYMRQSAAREAMRDYGFVLPGE